MGGYMFDATRRGVLAGTVATGLALGLPGCSQTASVQAARWTRKEVNSPDAARDLATYKIAVQQMLQLPPSDPRNWYRQGLLHLLDCPHGNWWFFDWHRPYVGYFEQICRELTGADTFALPYWDWTANNKLPDYFWGDTPLPNVLDPTSSHFFEDANDFLSAFTPALTAFWKDKTPAQATGLQRRGINSLDTLKAQIRLHYVGGKDARGAKAKIGELSGPAQAAVAIGVLQAGLAAVLFDVEADPIFPTNNVFNSGITADHYGESLDGAVIEDNPHNSVHGSIGGMMGRYLSPIDPIFWLHHANIDRIWTVWAGMQEARGRSADPSARVAAQFKAEEYNFFVDAKGRPVTANNTAGSYLTTAIFDYDYTGGSQVPARSKAMTERAPVYLQSKVTQNAFGVGQAATAAVALDDPGRANLEKLGKADLLGVAHVRFTPIAQGEYDYHLFLTGEGQTPDAEVGSKDYVLSYTFFGPPHMIHETGIVLALTKWLELNPDRLNGPLVAHFLATPKNDIPNAEVKGAQGSLQSVTLQVF